MILSHCEFHSELQIQKKDKIVNFEHQRINHLLHKIEQNLFSVSNYLKKN